MPLAPRLSDRTPLEGLGPIRPHLLRRLPHILMSRTSPTPPSHPSGHMSEMYLWSLTFPSPACSPELQTPQKQCLCLPFVQPAPQVLAQGRCAGIFAARINESNSSAERRARWLHMAAQWAQPGVSALAADHEGLWHTPPCFTMVQRMLVTAAVPTTWVCAPWPPPRGRGLSVSIKLWAGSEDTDLSSQ